MGHSLPTPTSPPHPRPRLPQPPARRRPSPDVRGAGALRAGSPPAPPLPARASEKEGGENEAPPLPSPPPPHLQGPRRSPGAPECPLFNRPSAGTASRLPLPASALRKGAPLGKRQAGQHPPRRSRDSRPSARSPPRTGVRGANSARKTRGGERGPFPAQLTPRLQPRFRNLFGKAQKKKKKIPILQKGCYDGMAPCGQRNPGAFSNALGSTVKPCSRQFPPRTPEPALPVPLWGPEPPQPGHFRPVTWLRNLWRAVLSIFL